MCHEQEAVHGGADWVCIALGRGGAPERRGLPQDGDLGAALLSLEEAVCGDRRGRDPAAEAVGRGEPAPEDAGGEQVGNNDRYSLRLMDVLCPSATS